MAKLLNLDKFIAEDKVFRVQGMDFRVPGLISVEKVLRISKLGQEAEGNPERVANVMSALWQVLAPANEGKTEEDFQSRISANMLKELLPYVFGDQGGEDVDSGVVDLSKKESGAVV